MKVTASHDMSNRTAWVLFLVGAMGANVCYLESDGYDLTVGFWLASDCRAAIANRLLQRFVVPSQVFCLLDTENIYSPLDLVLSQQRDSQLKVVRESMSIH
jgi:hypothetical protein